MPDEPQTPVTPPAMTTSSVTTQPASTPTPPTTPDPPPAPSIASVEDPAPVGAPETYADFTAPEGFTLDKAAIEDAAPIFKELNLTQEQAQKLVSLQADRDAKTATAARDAYIKTREGWANEVKAEFGTRLPEVRTEIGKALATLPADVRDPFRTAMDQTGVGDNPAFVRAFYALAKSLNEGRHVPAGGPSPTARPNGGRPASAAQAIYGIDGPRSGAPTS